MTADAIRTLLNNFTVNFISILYEALPFIILGAIIAGILEEFLPQKLITRILPKRRLISIFVGGMLGLIFPMCECGIIPVMRRLLRKGLPLSCCIAYLLAGPIINVVVILSTYTAFTGTVKSDEGVELPVSAEMTPHRAATIVGLMSSPTPLGGVVPSGDSPALPEGGMEQVVRAQTSFQLNATWMVILRVALGYVIAVTTAFIVDWQFQKYGYTLLKPIAVPSPDPDSNDETTSEKKPLLRRLSNVSETALHDFIDITVFLILGALLASGVKLWLTGDQIEQFSLSNAWVVILGMMALAVVLCLCSEADAFVAASFTQLVPSAKLAFLVLGPMMDFKLYFMYTRVFRPRLIWTIILSVLIQVFVYCLILHFLWQITTPSWMGTTTS